jgi:hypothetical protein
LVTPKPGGETHSTRTSPLSVIQYRDQEAIRLIVARFLRTKGYLAK